MNRRDFLQHTTGSVFAASATSYQNPDTVRMKSMNGKLRVVLVGTGIRGITRWGRELLKNYSDVLEMVGLCDINSKRLAYAQKYIGVTCPLFTDFDDMLRRTKPDAVIVTTIDCFHAKYICKAMESGYDVITEKPMVTDEQQCQAVLDTEKRTGKNLTVTLNYRYSPEAEKIKEIILSGEIGQLTSVDFNYFLDIYHGASYYRRWHGFKQYNGSLLVAKSVHHFDLLNWWLGAEPVEVNAYAELRKYGYNGEFRSPRCMSCPYTKQCEFYWDITANEFLMNLYVHPESEDGYIRDACVYRTNINIWDTMAVQVRYHNRILLSYSLNVFMPYEGYAVGFNGTKGRLDVRVFHRQSWEVDRLADFRVTQNFQGSRTFTIQKEQGGHWGADLKMQDMIFRGPRPDPIGQQATTREAALACLIGIAARRSIEQQHPLKVEELVKI